MLSDLPIRVHGENALNLTHDGLMDARSHGHSLVVVPGHPRHVTQRGIGRVRIFIRLVPRHRAIKCTGLHWTAPLE